MNKFSTPFASCTSRAAAAIPFFVLFAAAVSSVQVFGAGPDARTIMQGVDQQDTSHDATFRAEFNVFDKDNHSAKKRFLYRRIGLPGSSKILVVFSDPQEIRGVALLSITQPGAPSKQYIYTPAIRRVRDVAPQERSARFIGTDFTYEDISEHVLDDFSYKLLSENETIENHKTYKIQATPVDPQRSQYKFIYDWVARDVPVIMHAEMYDAQGREVRTLHATDLKHVSGVWGARHVEMASVQDGTRTVLTIDEVKFNTGLDEKLFTPESLEGTR
jgi:outer membrane lipoprotein-sorting protein